MPDVDFKQLQKETMVAITELRGTIDTYGAKSTDVEEKQANVEAKIAEYDAANQKLVGEIAAERKAREDMAEKVAGLEKGILEFGSGNQQKSGDYKQSPEYKAFNAMASSDFDGGGVTAEQKALLRTDVNGQGGYLTIPEMSEMVLKNITEISPIRMFSRVKTIGSRSMHIPIRDTIPTATFEGEAQDGGTSASAYKGETLTTFALQTTVPFTREQMMSKNFDIESEIMQDVKEAFAFAEGRNMVASGTGAKMPQAILRDPRVTSGARQTLASGELDMESIRRLTGDLKTGYDPMYFFNRTTKADLLTQTGSDGQYLWSMAESAAPAMLSGYKYALFEDMPDIASGSYAVGFGDLMRAYCITDFSGMEMVRDDVTRKKERIIELTFFRWLTGQVVLPEGITLLQIKS